MSQQALPSSGDGERPPKKKSRFKLIMILASLLFLFGGIGGGGYWWLFARPNAQGLSFLTSDETSQATPEVSEKKDEKEAKPEAEGKTDEESIITPRALKPVPLPSLMVNLVDPPGNRYLKIGMDVELTNTEAAKILEEQSARVRDSLILVITGKSVRELVSMEGKILLKNEVAGRLNQILGSPQVIRIFFTEFTIQ